jgi:hypothetical protein
LVVLVGPEEGPERKRKKRRGDRRKDGEEGRKERIGNRGGCKLITKFEIIQI